MDLNLLNAANALRLPQFKNKHGEMAHSHPAGADWSPRMWLIALMGEVGELTKANESCKVTDIANEAADVQTCLDLYCQRALDGFDPRTDTVEYGLVQLMKIIGAMCEAHKKHVRGDMDRHSYTIRMGTNMRGATLVLEGMDKLDIHSDHLPMPNPHGVNLSDATVRKFNEVSQRVGADVFLTDTRVVRHIPGEIE